VTVSKIAIIEDDPYLALTLAKILSFAGYSGTIVHAPNESQIVALQEYDLVILDIGLPGASGLQLARLLRRTSNLPVLFISGSNAPKIAVLALRSGGDDFVRKPFDVEELLERVSSLLRRTRPNARSDASIAIGDNKFDFVRQGIKGPREELLLELTERETVILRMLLDPPGLCVTREKMCQIACRREWTPMDRSIDVHVSNLRKKLKRAGITGLRISVRRNQGYIANLEPARLGELAS
jgi:DNA-binding response OmpR family regulator